jgi:condensin complex subunit 2
LSFKSLVGLFTKNNPILPDLQNNQDDDGAKSRNNFDDSARDTTNCPIDYYDDGDGDDDNFATNFYKEEKTQVKDQLVDTIKMSSNNNPSDNPIGFARRAKRVDLKELKDALWKEQQSSESNAFSSIIANLKSLSIDTQKDLSVPFCFICILHLANENNLSIKKDSADDLLLVKEQQVKCMQ